MNRSRLHFFVRKRKNVHRKKGIEWALDIRFVDGNIWTLKTWADKPSKKMVKEDADLVIRSLEFYRSQIQIPKFDLTIEELF